MKAKALITLPAIALLTACVSKSTILTNQSGQWVRCHASGGGWLGAPMAASNHSRCVEDFEKIGYVAVPDVQWGVKFASWQSQPVKVTEVVAGSPAEASGIKVGDIIKSIDKTPITKGVDIFKLLSEKQPGNKLQADIERDGAQISVTSVLQARK